MNNQKDYYRILGISSDASREQIKEAYRKFALQHHPDRNRDNPESAARMKELNEAYAVLSDPEKRTSYDSLRSRYGSSARGQFRHAYSDQDIFRGSDIGDIFEEMARSFGLRGFDEIFKEFYGPSYRKFEFHRPGVHGRGYVFYGGIGRGKAGRKRSPRQASPLLGKVAQALLGSMGIRNLPLKGADIQEEIVLSPEIAQSGGPYAYEHRMNGKKLVVQIPAGIREGKKIRLSGMGKQGKGGAPAGDLYLKVKIKKPLLQKIREFIGA